MMNDEREERPLRLFNSAFRIQHSAFSILFLPGMWGGDSGGGRAAVR